MPRRHEQERPHSGESLRHVHKGRERACDQLIARAQQINPRQGLLVVRGSPRRSSASPRGSAGAHRPTLR